MNKTFNSSNQNKNQLKLEAEELSNKIKLQAHSSRYFVNPFFDDSKLAAKLVTEEWILEHVKLLAEQISKRKISSEEYKQEGPYVGLSGIAYVLLLLTEANKGLDYTKEINNILEKQSKFSTSNKSKYLTGRFGFYLIKFLANLIDTDYFKRKVNKLVEYLIDENVDNEILNGRAGFLAGFLMLRTEYREEIISNDQIKRVLNAMLEAGRTYSVEHDSVANLMYEWHEKEYLGAAHGLAGILQIFLSYWDFLDSSAEGEVKQTIDWFLSIQLKDGNFPSNAGKIGKEAELVYWCHGATGVLQMLLAAHLVFEEEKYLEAAKRCANLIWRKGILSKGPGICHGIAGSGYGFLLLYRHTKEEEWLNKAKTFGFIMMSKSFKEEARTPDRPWSLFEGWAGALCFLVDLLEPLKAQFPMVPILFDY